MPVEKVRLDNVHLEELYTKLGPTGAEDFISRTMEELAVQLAKLGRNHSAGRIDEVRKVAVLIGSLSDQIGMSNVARVALDVADLSARNDGAALAATVARLGRIGESSLMAVWDLQGLSG
ncbi:MAG: hypothetical protein WBN04_16545 [Paracoccaceae bacterium]